MLNQIYSLTSENIERLYIKNKHISENKEYKKKSIVNTESTLFSPYHDDKLFWIFYILKYGIEDYNLIGKNHFFIEQEKKIHQIKLIRKNKDILKQNKWKKNNLESNLIGDKKINLTTFFCICYLNNINICIRNNKCLYDCVNESFDVEINIIEQNKSVFSIDLNEINLEKYKIMKDNYWIINNISKPLRAISYYKVNDLISICKKLDIPIYKKIQNKDKILKKKELYMKISEYISF